MTDPSNICPLLPTARLSPAVRPWGLDDAVWVVARPGEPVPPAAPSGAVHVPSPKVAGPLQDDLREARALLGAVVEVLAGRRKAGQLEGWASPRVISALASCETHRSAGVRVAAVRAQAPRDSVIELAVSLGSLGGRRAAALRLERRRARWVCTQLEVALAPRRIVRAA